MTSYIPIESVPFQNIHKGQRVRSKYGKTGIIDHKDPDEYIWIEWDDAARSYGGNFHYRFRNVDIEVSDKP